MSVEYDNRFLIQSTVADIAPVIQSKSRILKIKFPLLVKLYDSDQLLLVTTIPVLLNHVNVASTGPVVIVPEVGIYCILAVGNSGSTSNNELTGPLIVPSLTDIVTPVLAWVSIVFNVVVDCPVVKVTPVV